jgi:hypothetical protein
MVSYLHEDTCLYVPAPASRNACIFTPYNITMRSVIAFFQGICDTVCYGNFTGEALMGRQKYGCDVVFVQEQDQVQVD